MAKAVHPIMARALTPLAAYFGSIIGVYYFLETTTGFLVMAPLSAFTAVILLLAEHRWLADYRSIRQLEVVVSASAFSSMPISLPSCISTRSRRGSPIFCC